MTRILLAVDSGILRPRLISIISEIPGVQTICDVENTKQVVEEVRCFKPDVVLLSLLKLSQSSTRLASLLRAENPHLPLIALTGPFTTRDESGWQKVGGDCVFDVTLGHKMLVDYISNFVAKNKAPAETSI